jgi:hypothetical protein
LDGVRPLDLHSNTQAKPDKRKQLQEQLQKNLDQLLTAAERRTGKRDSGVKMLANFMTKHLPGVGDRVDEGRRLKVGILRFEPLVQKLVTHTRGKLVVGLNHKALDVSDQSSVLFTFQLLRTMIENAWGFRVQERDEEQHDHNRADLRAKELQQKFNDAKVPQLCIDFIAMGLDKAVCSEAMGVLVTLLYQEGGNLSVQKTVNKYLVETNSELFFQAMDEILHGMMGSFAISPLQREEQMRAAGWSPPQQDQSEVFGGRKYAASFRMERIPPPAKPTRGVEADQQEEDQTATEGGESGRLSQDKDLTTGLKAVHTLQMLCEGHYVPNQMIISLQSGHNASSTNVLDSISSHLCVLCDRVVRIAAKFKDPMMVNLDETDLAAVVREDILKTTLLTAYKMTSLVLELVQGPCERNIEHLALNTELLEHMNNLVCAELLECEDVRKLKTQMLRTLKGLLEGQSDKQPSMVYERLLSVLHLEALKLFVYPPELNFADESIDLVQAIEDREQAEHMALDAIQIESLVLLQMLTQYSPELKEELHLSDTSGFRDEVNAVEVVWDGITQKHYFRRPTMCKRLSLKMKLNFQEHVDRFDQESKLRDFITRARHMYEELKWIELLQRKGIAALFNEDVQGFLTWVLFFVNFTINTLFVVALSWQEAETTIVSAASAAGATASADANETMVVVVDAHIANDQEGVMAALRSIEIVTICCTLAVILVVTVRVALRRLLLEFRRHTARVYSGHSSLLDTAEFIRVHILKLDPRISEACFYCIYLGFAVASPNSPLVSAIFFLTQLIMKFETCQAVLMSVWVPLKELVITSVLVVFTLYIFAVAIFMRLRDVVPVGGCDTLQSCLQVLANNGLRSGGGIGEYFDTAVDNQRRDYGTRKYILELCFFLLVIIILMNIIFGLIIDTFSTLREEKKERQRDIAQICFICGVEKSQFDLGDGGDFHHHLREEHHIWDYFSFMVFIWEQDRDDDDGLEKAVRLGLSGDVCSLTWFPRHSAEGGEGKLLESGAIVPEEKPKGSSKKLPTLHRKIHRHR